MPISDASHPTISTPMQYHKPVWDKNWENSFIYFFTIFTQQMLKMKSLKNVQLYFVLSTQLTCYLSSVSTVIASTKNTTCA